MEIRGLNLAIVAYSARSCNDEAFVGGNLSKAYRKVVEAEDIVTCSGKGFCSGCITKEIVGLSISCHL